MSWRRPRICMLTARDFSHHAFRCTIYEGEDVLLDIDDVDCDLSEAGKRLPPEAESPKKNYLVCFTRTFISTNMAFESIGLTKEYDLFVAYMPLTQDLIRIPAVRGWKDYCRTSVCWIDEFWAADIPKLKYWLPALSHFDHIVLGYSGTVAAVAEAIKRPCHWVPARGGRSTV